MKFSNLLLPTPNRMRKLGNALVGASQGISVPLMLANYKWLAIAIFIAGWVGKFLTEMYAEDSAPKS